MKSFYMSETVTWTSNPKKGKPHGKRNVVTIKNGKGTKTAATINASGKPITRKTVKLSKKEVRNTLSGTFMPGFWRNCPTGDCGRDEKRNALK